MRESKRVLHIVLLGQFRLEHGQRNLSLGAPSHQALLAYRVLHPGQDLTRQQLAFSFWPDSSEK